MNLTKNHNLHLHCEWWDGKFILLMGMLFLAISSIPYLYGYFSTPPDKVFMGLVGRDVLGTYMHFSWEVQSEEGSNLFVDRLTPEKHKPFYFNLEWWLLGRFLRYSGLAVIPGFQVERCLTVFLAIVIVYYFLSCFFKNRFETRCVLFLVLFAPGLGWIFWLIKQYTGTDFGLWMWDIEGINLFGFMMCKPHYARSLSFVCLAYAFLLKGEDKDKITYFFLAGLSVVIHGFIRPYNLPTAFLLFALFPLLISVKEGGISKRKVRNYLALILTSLVVIAYYLWLYYFTILKDAFGQVSLRPLSPLELMSWLGLPLLLAFLGFDGFRDFEHKEKWRIFLYLWGTVLLVLIYSYPLLRWGMEGAGPLCILVPIMAGTTVFERVVPILSKSRIGKKLTIRGLSICVIFIIILVSFPSNLVLLRNTVKDLSAHSRPYYLSKDLVNAFNWLRQNIQGNNSVMCAVENGSYLSTLSRVKAFTGCSCFTLDFAEKNQMVSEFFSRKANHDFRKKLLQHYEVTYIFYSDVERGMGGFNPKEALYLKEVYENPLVIIFEVKRDRL